MSETHTDTRSRRLVWTGAGMPATDGAGVKLNRVIGQPALPDLDPFLMLDEFGSDDPKAYIAGFPRPPAPRLRDRHLHAGRPHAPHATTPATRACSARLACSG